MTDKQNTSTLGNLAGAFLLAAALFAFGAMVAYGVTLKVTSPVVIGFLVLGFASLGLWLAGRAQQPKTAGDHWAKERTLLGVNSISTLFLVLLLLMGVNYLSARRNKTFDLTSNKVNSLSEQTTKVLEKLSGKVKFTIVFQTFLGQGGPSPADRKLFENYKNSSDKITLAFLNAREEPAKYEEMKISGFTGEPMLVIQADDKKEAKPQQVTVLDEQNITSALMKLGESKAAKIYVLTGHGEFSLTAPSGQINFSQAKARLESQNYQIGELNLAKLNAVVPNDAAAILAIAPQSDLTPGEATLLGDYLGAKGRMMMSFGPQKAPLKTWKALAAKMGATVLDGAVIDSEQAFQSTSYPLGEVSDTTKHPVLGGVGQNKRIVFPLSSPLKAATTLPPGVTAVSLMDTSQVSQAASMLKGVKPQPGPFSLALACESGAAPPSMPGAPPSPPSADGARLLVVGSSFFASDTLFDKFANADFFLAGINWVVGNELLVTIPPKPPVTNTLTMTDAAVRWVAWLALFVLPGLSLFVGGLVWWRRR